MPWRLSCHASVPCHHGAYVLATACPLPAVYLRSAHQLDREICCLVAATEGSTCFLLLPTTFWVLPDVAPLVRQLQAAAGCCRLGRHTSCCRPWACLLRCGHDMPWWDSNRNI
jgi:hypothetical protein